MAEIDAASRQVKRQKVDSPDHAFDASNPFTKGKSEDEVELKFDNGQSLFVSKVFLTYSSPVFERMFQSDFKEKDAKYVSLEGKDYDAFLEMLRFLHPRIRTEFSEETSRTMCIYKMGHEYQIPTVLNKAKRNLFLKAESALYYEKDTLLEILSFADCYNIEEVTSVAAERLSRYSIKSVFNNQKFKTLSKSTRLKIYQYRLHRCEKDEYIEKKLEHTLY